MLSSTIEIITIGNELLIGKIVNTNAQWLSKQITNIGGRITRITTIADDIEEIASVLKEAISRGSNFVITIGGLGPTFDDKTLTGIAKAINVELELNDEALRMVKEKYSDYSDEGHSSRKELTPHRIKMAKIPKGAEPIFNPEGTAPGVLFRTRETRIIALPGVPSEMKAIFKDSVKKMIRKAVGKMLFFESTLEVKEIPEPDLAPLIDRTMKDNPLVYIKSHPKGGETKSKVQLHISITSSDSKEAKKRLVKTIIEISELIQEKGGKIRKIQR